MNLARILAARALALDGEALGGWVALLLSLARSHGLAGLCIVAGALAGLVFNLGGRP